jgi:hypothetical protein
MSVFLPTTLMSLYRGVSENDLGEGTDNNVVIYASDLPAVITEKSQRTWLPTEGRMTTVQRYIVRFRPGTDIREMDRIRDQFTNAWYQVQEVINVPLVIGAPDVRCAAIRVAAVDNSSSKTQRVNW